jgi:hypothetical protein
MIINYCLLPFLLARKVRPKENLEEEDIKSEVVESKTGVN